MRIEPFSLWMMVLSHVPTLYAVMLSVVFSIGPLVSFPCLVSLLHMALRRPVRILSLVVFRVRGSRPGVVWIGFAAGAWL